MVVLLGATAAVLVASWLLHARCLDEPGVTHYSLGCFTDLEKLYALRGHDTDQRPYVDQLNEYPVLTGAFQHLAAKLSTGESGFFWANALLLAPFALGTMWLLAARPGWRPLIWAGPPLLFYAVHNWDLLPVFLATAGLVLHRRGHAGASGAVMALAGMAKWYPLLFLPLMGLHWLRVEQGLGSRGWRFGLGAVGALAAVNLPVALAHPDGWLATLRFHGVREANFETPWFYLRELGTWSGFTPLEALMSRPVVDGLMAAAVLGGLFWAGRAVWRGMDVIRASAIVLLVFLLASKVFSVQYALWFVPFLVLLPLPRRQVVAFLAADAFVYLTVWPRLNSGGVWLGLLVVTVTARWLVLAWMLKQLTRAAPLATTPPAQVEAAI